MIREWIFSKLHSKKSNTTINRSQVSLLYPELPFYGKKGTLCRIEETEKSYYTVLYNQDGTLDPIKKPTPKRKGKTLPIITKEYYDELKKYLDFTNNQYMNYRNTRLHKQINKKHTTIALIVSGTMMGVFLPAWFSSVKILSYVGAIMEATSMLTFYITYDLKKEITIDEKKKAFIEQYNFYQENLINYNQIKAEKQKISQTKYTEISRKKEPEQTKVKSKTKELKRENEKIEQKQAA